MKKYNGIIEEVSAELARDRALLEKLDAAYDELPSGYIEVKEINGTDYFFRVFQKNGRRKRVAITDARLISDIRFRADIHRARPVLKENINACERFIEAFRDYDPYKFSGPRVPDRRLFREGDVCDEEWIENMPARNPFREEDYRFETRRGEKVRSKSEMMIADILFEYGLQYRSDCPVSVGGKVLYPDFQILRRKDHTPVLWEHNGLTGSSSYVLRSYEKLAAYNRAGYIIGRNLILTSETEHEPLTRSVIIQQLGEFGLI